VKTIGVYKYHIYHDYAVPNEFDKPSALGDMNLVGYYEYKVNSSPNSYHLYQWTHNCITRGELLVWTIPTLEQLVDQTITCGQYYITIVCKFINNIMVDITSDDPVYQLINAKISLIRDNKR
jgi:hypothetical protein